jgi:hypothetical protein
MTVRLWTAVSCAVLSACVLNGVTSSVSSSSPSTYWQHAVVLGTRLLWNVCSSGAWPDPLPPASSVVSEVCTEAALVRDVAVVMAVKDSCTQGPAALAALAGAVPRDTNVVYVTPAAPDCAGVMSSEALLSVFPNGVLLSVAASASPFEAFLAAEPHVQSQRHTLFLHTDVYTMDARRSVCALHVALDAHDADRVPFAAPQLYERGADGAVVPHAHHGTLHTYEDPLRGGGCALGYTTDVLGVLRRRAGDFVSSWQRDFLEDHAFMGRTATYRTFLDPEASFTLEYLDVALTMRAHGATAVYVPESRFLFDVDAGQVGWRDLAHTAWKRSAVPARRVHRHMRHKWGCLVPDEPIWRYVRHTALAGVDLRGSSLPSDVGAQMRAVHAWFSAAGLEHDPTSTGLDENRACRAQTRSTKVDADGDGDAFQSVATHSAVLQLPRTSSASSVQHYIRPPRRQHDDVDGDDDMDVMELNACDAHHCHLMYTDQQGMCRCFARTDTFDSRFASWMPALLRRLKLPARAWTYAQMHRPPTVSTTASTGTGGDAPALLRRVRCVVAEKECCVDGLHLGPRSRLLLWRWPHSASST